MTPFETLVLLKRRKKHLSHLRRLVRTWSEPKSWVWNLPRNTVQTKQPNLGSTKRGGLGPDQTEPWFNLFLVKAKLTLRFTLIITRRSTIIKMDWWCSFLRYHWTLQTPYVTRRHLSLLDWFLKGSHPVSRLATYNEPLVLAAQADSFHRRPFVSEAQHRKCLLALALFLRKCDVSKVSDYRQAGRSKERKVSHNSRSLSPSLSLSHTHTQKNTHLWRIK